MRINRLAASVAAAVMVASGMSLAATPAASALTGITTEFQESVSSSDPVFNKWDEENCPSTVESGGSYFRAFELTVSEPGTYTYYDVGYEQDVPGTIDIEVGFFDFGQFDPADPEVGCLDTIDDEGDVTFPSAGTYTLVLTSHSTGATGLGYWSLTGPGATMINSAAASDNPIPPWVQAYGVSSPATTCEDGWQASWQEWAVSVTGGYVCTREIPSLG